MVIIVGAGIGGLSLALCLEREGIECRIFEAAAELAPLGVGINLLPHAMRTLTELGLQELLLAAGVETREVNFYNRFGQFIYSDARGRFADYPWPQISLHRGELQRLLAEAVVERLGEQALVTGCRFARFEQDDSGVRASFARSDNLSEEVVAAPLLIGCDGIRSAVRRQLHPAGDPLIYSGITMWRGVTRWPSFLSGATMVYAGWLKTGKVIVYPVTKPRPDDGLQLVNWLCEFYVPPRDPGGDWSQAGKLEDFLWACQEMRFDWLDVPAMVKAADYIYEYPMVDRDPLPFWTRGRVTLLGDAAHPMYPRGSNGAGQAIVDARALANSLKANRDWCSALQIYESERRPATSRVVRANRTIPPDAILREVFERTGDRPFASIGSVISPAELDALAQSYKEVAGFDRRTLAR